jgi:hypothetical protein
LRITIPTVEARRVDVTCRCEARLGRATVWLTELGATVSFRPRAGYSDTAVSPDPRWRSDRARRRNLAYPLHRFTCRRCPTTRTVRHETLADAAHAAAVHGRDAVVVGRDL